MGVAHVTAASSKLAKAQEAAALKGLRAAVPLYVEATNAMAAEERCDAAVAVLMDVLNVRERKRSLFGSKEINPLGPERPVVGKQFAKLTRTSKVTDPILELLGTLANENPDDPTIRLANAEGLYRAGYMADAIDEYRYCEKLIPDDGAIVARLGELYAIMSRNSEAVDYLQRGIGELMQSQRFDDVPEFAQKLLEVSPQAASDVSRWLESLSEDAFSRQRERITRVLETARDLGLDDARWSPVEERLAALPEEAPPAAPRMELCEEPAEHEPAAAGPEEQTPARQAMSARETEPEPQTSAETQEREAHWAGTQPSGVAGTSANVWEDVSSVEPASDDEMRILFGPAEPTEQGEAVAGFGNGLTSGARSQPAAPSAPATYTPSVSIGSTQPTSAGGLPPGLAAFTRRKADTAFNAGDFAGAAASYERLMKAGFDPAVASPLLECYLGLERFDEASSLGLALADHQADAGDLERAVSTLALVLEHTSDPTVERRHSELLAANN